MSQHVAAFQEKLSLQPAKVDSDLKAAARCQACEAMLLILQATDTMRT